MEKNLTGYLTIEGKIKFLGEKALRETSRSKELRFAVESNTDNIINIRAFGWKKEDTDEIMVSCKDKSTKRVAYSDREWLEDGETIIGTSVKAKGGEVTVMVDVDAVDFIKDNFKNGDSVFVNLKSEIDTYFKTIKWTISKMYACSDDLNFESEGFEEKNNGNQWVAFEKVEDGKLYGYIFNKKDDVLPMVFDLTEYVSAEDFEGYVLGDLVQLDFEQIRKPIYEEVTVKEEKKETANKFIPKGKYAKTESDKGNSTYKAIKGFEEKFLLVGIKNEEKAAFKPEDLTSILPVTDDESDDLPF